jgi:hypothetical protein
MNEKFHNQASVRESFLFALLNKVTKEYKALLDFTRRSKPLKIVDIVELSNIPGETIFTIQLTNKNCILSLKASEIISKKYDLNDFNEFHADMIREAARGKLIDFLKITEKKPCYKIAEKKFDKTLQQYLFIIETKDNVRFRRTADELSNDKNLLLNMDIRDIYDIGFTEGCESILKEKAALLLAKCK